VVFDYAANDYKAMPDAFRRKGYATEAYHGDRTSYWNRSNTYPVFGFDKYIGKEAYHGKEFGLGVNDRDFFVQTVDKIAKLKEPYYAHLISVSSHTPYEIPEELQELKLDSSGLTQLQKDYLQSARYTDTALGEFMEKLKQKISSEKLAVVVMGDHESFVFEKGDRLWAKTLGYPEGMNDLTDFAARTVPFILYAPGSALAGQDSRPASQIDIYPTLANLLELEQPKSVLGTDLFGDQMPTVVHRSRGIGASVDRVQRGELSYFSYGYDGNKACYSGTARVGVEVCQPIYDFAVRRATVSDSVIMGNRLDLLAP
jgi:phosphoglycerol transferase MdoB-like AlkP superfamily enzyme